jgi:hypothetical protein
VLDARRRRTADGNADDGTRLGRSRGGDAGRKQHSHGKR